MGVLLLLLLGHLAHAQSTAPARFALVVGYNQPDVPNVPALRYADDDAVATARLLREAGVDVRLLVELDDDSRAMHPSLEPDGGPTLENVTAAMKQLRQSMVATTRTGVPTEFYFFYSGHGDVQNGEGYVTLSGARLTRTTLHRDILGRSPAQVNHVIVDACKSYFLVFEKGPGGTREPAPQGFGQRTMQSRARNIGYILSTSSDKESHEWEEFQGGVFSHELRSGLWGAADVNVDGAISYAELGAFLEVANQGIPNPRFRPDFLVVPPAQAPTSTPSSDPALLLWSDSNALWVDDITAGHVYLEDAQGLRLVDAHPARGQMLSIRLPQQRPVFIRTAQAEQERILADAGGARLSSIPLTPVSLTRKGALHLAFLELFSQPFGAEQVVSYRARMTPVQTTTQPTPGNHSSGVNIGKAVLRTVGLGTVALGAAITAAPFLVASILTGWALQQIVTANQLPQRELQHRNEVIRALNIAIGIFLFMGSISGVVTLAIMGTGVAVEALGMVLERL